MGDNPELKAPISPSSNAAPRTYAKASWRLLVFEYTVKAPLVEKIYIYCGRQESNNATRDEPFSKSTSAHSR